MGTVDDSANGGVEDWSDRRGHAEYRLAEGRRRIAGPTDSFPAGSSQHGHDHDQRGETDPFEAATEPYRRELLAHCYRMTGSVDEAEDLVQETYVRAWRAFDRFEGRSSVRTWLYRIATNVCLDAHSTAGTGAPLPSRLGPPSARPLCPPDPAPRRRAGSSRFPTAWPWTSAPTRRR